MSTFAPTLPVDQTAQGSEQARAAHDGAHPLTVLEDLVLRHTRALHMLTAATQEEPAGYEIVDLSAGTPTKTLETVTPHDPVAGVMVLNDSPVTVNIGWPGNRAIDGGGVPVPGGSYLVLPINTNAMDCGTTAASIAADAQITIIIFKVKKTPRLSAGSLLGSTSTGVSAVTSESPGSVSVGVASALILPANTSRKGLQLVNSSANAIGIGLGHAAVLGNDVWLAPSGGAWDGTLSGKLWLGALYAIAAGAGSNLALAEV